MNNIGVPLNPMIEFDNAARNMSGYNFRDFLRAHLRIMTLHHFMSAVRIYYKLQIYH